MAATSDNYDIVTSGITYTIASDFVKPVGAGETAHYQVVKIAYGADDSVTYVSEGFPLPISIGACGSMTVNATDLDIRNLYGGTPSGSTSGIDYVGIQGIASGYPIGITVSAPLPVTVSSLSNFGIFGVTGATAVYVQARSPLPVGICGSWTNYEFLAASGYYSLATTIVGTTGTSLNVVGVSGGVAVGITVGTLNVTGSSFSIRNLYGGSALGSTAGIDYVGIQGISSGYPVGITVSAPLPVTVSSFSNLGIFGVTGATAVYVQGSNFSIRGITAATDTITVYGTGIESTVPTSLYAFAGSTAAIEAVYSTNNALNVNVSTITGVTVSATDLDIRDLNYTTDTVTIVGQGATDNLSLSTVPTYMNAAVSPTGTLTRVSGTTGAGWCGAAVNMYLVNSGFSFNAYATFSAQIGITAPSYAPIPVTGTTSATQGLWVAGDTANGPVIVKGYSGGFMPIELANLDTPTSTVNATIAQVKTNTDFLVAMKKALYDPTVSVGAFDFSDKSSIYTLVRDSIGAELVALGNTVVPNNTIASTQDSLAVTVVSTKPKSSFISRTNCATGTPQNLTSFNNGAGYTCSNGIRIKTSRIATGANASQNEIMCVISEADASTYGASAGVYSYVMYHGDEMFFEVDNINRLKVFYPAYSAGLAPHNTGSGVTFSFYAS